jgi:hypothetical protein
MSVFIVTIVIREMLIGDLIECPEKLRRTRETTRWRASRAVSVIRG